MIRNISVIILLFGVILITIYITRVYHKLYPDNIIDTQTYMSSTVTQSINQTTQEQQTIYDLKPSIIFKNMFSFPSIGTGYNEGSV